MPGYHPHVLVEHPIGGLDRARVAARVERVLDEVVRGLSEPIAAPLDTPAVTDDPAERIPCADPWADAQRLFVERGWTDG
ncbi:MAG: hypothetical protein Q8S13_04780, partial [Dehalococcoidia bacterium]|nr:hypothetical protein [Dehalococcoidia bacterium]